MSKASHISGYLNKRDLPAEQLLAAETGNNFHLPAVSIDNALRRELLDDFSIVAHSPASRSLGTQRFYYADKENLFFYIMEYQITQEHVFTEEARMFPWTIQELLNIRRFHVLDNTEKALNGEFTRQQRARAREMIHENLITHSVNNIADEVDSALSAAATSTDLANRINRLKTEVQVYKYSAGRELAIEGLAGLQYRIFFSHILDCYSSIGIADASEEQARIKEDSRRSQAIARLAELYDDESFITSLPMEL